MTLEHDLDRLIQQEVPSPAFRNAIHARIQAKISAPHALRTTIASIQPALTTHQRLKNRILSVIHPTSSIALEDTAGAIQPNAQVFARIKNAILLRLEPQQRPFFGWSVKWTAAIAVFVLAIRAMPFLLLAPSTYADVRIQLIPSGDVSTYVSGMWTPVTSPILLTGPTMIRTDSNGHATLIFGDRGIVRLDGNSTFKVYDDTVRHPIRSEESTARLIRGKIWALGLIPAFADGISIETVGGSVSVNTGSVGIESDEVKATITAYDRGATVTNTKQTVFIVAGERVVTKEDATLTIATLGTKAFISPWATENLKQDAVHREEIAELQAERQAQGAGILPTSFLYPAKRFAEKVDVLFTLTQDGRTEKRIAQANTRLHEALALLKTGANAEANASLSEYKDSLIQMAEGEEDNLVKYLLRKQIASASISLSGEQQNPVASVELLKQAVSDVSSAIPDADLKPKDVEGYILVNTLADINHTLSTKNDTASAAKTYAEIRPYLQSLLDEKNGSDPLLQKEAKSLLVSTSILAKKANATGQDSILSALESDIAQYVPQEQEQEQIIVSEEQLNARVSAMLSRIFIFRAHQSRYNQLLAEMNALKGDPNQGTLLRRLKSGLPVALGEYVNGEIKTLGGELKGRTQSLVDTAPPAINEKTRL